MPKFTVHVSGCDASTALLMDLDLGEQALLKEIHDGLRANQKACTPSLMVYKGDMLQYECEQDDYWNDIPGTEKPTADIDMSKTLIPLDGFHE